MPILSKNVDKKSIETVFSIAFCRHTGDKWQSKALLISIFDPRLSIVDIDFDCRLPGVVTLHWVQSVHTSHVGSIIRLKQHIRGKQRALIRLMIHN